VEVANACVMSMCDVLLYVMCCVCCLVYDVNDMVRCMRGGVVLVMIMSLCNVRCVMGGV